MYDIFLISDCSKIPIDVAMKKLNEQTVCRSRRKEKRRQTTKSRFYGLYTFNNICQGILEIMAATNRLGETAPCDWWKFPNRKFRSFRGILSIYIYIYTHTSTYRDIYAYIPREFVSEWAFLAENKSVPVSSGRVSRVAPLACKLFAVYVSGCINLPCLPGAARFVPLLLRVSMSRSPLPLQPWIFN